MSDDSLIEDVRDVAALLGRTEDRALDIGLTNDDLVGAVGEARCHLESALLLRGEALDWSSPDVTGAAPELG
jgi:tetrahydromethanopterin S-methyltransferase subunit F